MRKTFQYYEKLSVSEGSFVFENGAKNQYVTIHYFQAAKFLTFIYSVIMTAVVVGTAVQVAKDFSKGAPMNPSETNATSTTTTMNPNGEYSVDGTEE